MAVSSRVRTLVAVALVVVLLALAVPVALVRFPPAPPLAQADAVVVHAGVGGRLEAAEQLAAGGLAPTLVISRGEYSGWPLQDPDPLCEDPRPYEVVCVHPEPQTTAGEARVIAELARDRGWDELVAVTSEHHVARARTLLRQCTDAEVRMAPVPRAPSTQAVLREAAGLVAAVTVARAC